MSPNGDTVHWECRECHMLLSGTEFNYKSTNCHHSDFYQAKHNMMEVHYIQLYPVRN